MEKRLKPHKGKTIEGWYRDAEGKIRDPDGYEWFGHNVEVNSGVSFDGDDGGSDRVLKIFTMMLPPGNTLTYEEIYKKNEAYFMSVLKEMSCRMDWNYAPHFQRGSDGILNIILTCIPSRFYFKKIREGEIMRGRVGGVPAVTTKVDSPSRVMQKNSNIEKKVTEKKEKADIPAPLKTSFIK